MAGESAFELGGRASEAVCGVRRAAGPGRITGEFLKGGRSKRWSGGVSQGYTVRPTGA